MEPRGLRNNNPGNIRHDNTIWQGEAIPGQDNDFKQFETIEYGYRAMLKLIQNYNKLYRLNTIRKIISRYAPSNENHTEHYIDNVSQWSGIAADTIIDTNDRETMVSLIAAMSRIENGKIADCCEIRRGWQLLHQYK